MQRFRELWQSGLDARHIDELINDSFYDFAPYADAEQQRVTFSRQRDTTMSTAVTMENNGDLAFQTQHLQVGSMLFTTTGKCQVNGAMRVPLPLGSFSLASTEGDPNACPVLATPEPSPGPRRRFFFTTRGAQLMYGIGQPHTALYRNTFGQLEWDLDFMAPRSGRHVYGIRSGPISARLAAAPSLFSGTGGEENSSANLSGSNPTDRTRSFWERSMYTVDLSCCIPLYLFGKKQFAKNPSISGNVNTVDPVTPQEHAKARRDDYPQGPLALTVGFRKQFTVGDTLLAIAIQTDRAVMNTIRHNGCPQGLDAVPVPLSFSSPKASEGDGENVRDFADGVKNGVNREAGAWNLFCIPETTAQLLVLQTLATSANQPLDASGNPTNATILGTSGFSSHWSPLRGANRTGSTHKPWYSLPTLVSYNLSFRKQLLRISMASIFHDEMIDFEAAVVADATPLMPSTPTLLKLGFNNSGRVAAGIVSLFYDALSVTLGVNVMRGEDMRFGVEIKF